MEALKGSRAGQYSIRINGQWRICFEWRDGHAYNVEIVDLPLIPRKNDVSELIHPGEHVAEFLDEFGISQYRLATDIRVPPRRINEIVQGKRAITADTALRLGRYFGTTAEFWMNLQDKYELAQARRRLGARLEEEITPRTHA